MKRLSVILLALALFLFAICAPVIAEPQGAAGSFDNTDADLALAGRSGYQLCLSAIAYDATNATDDVNFWFATGDTAKLTAAVTAGATTIALANTTGVATNAQVVFQHPDGRYAETKALSAIDTVAALDYAYPKNTKVFEVAQAVEWANVGTDAATLNVTNGFLCAPRGSPIGAIIDANLMTYMSGFYTK
jgi:hypothetical protein